MRSSWRAAVSAMRGPEAPSGWPTAIAPPFMLTRLSSNGRPRPFRQAKTWAAKASLISITSMSERLSPARASAFFDASTGPMPMIRGGTPATPLATIRAKGLAPTASPALRLATIIATAPSLMPEALPAVVTPPSCNGRNFASASRLVCGRGCSSSATRTGPARPDLAVEKARRFAGGVFLLRGGGKKVAGLAGDLIVAGQIVGGFGHCVGAEFALDPRIGKARADCRIVNAAVTAERHFGLVHDKRRPAHALDPAGQEHLTLAAGDGLRGHHDRVQAATAIALQHRAGDFDRQPGEEPGMARHAATVFAGLIGAADDDILDPGRVERAFFDDRRNDRGEHVVGAHPRQGAGVAAERGTQTVIEIGVEHRLFPPGRGSSPPARAVLSSATAVCARCGAGAGFSRGRAAAATTAGSPASPPGRRPRLRPPPTTRRPARPAGRSG